ncbi:MAG: hypothetical protein JWM53_3863 [bacterium]|nr:hypothetical protein [bacterium]
MPAHLGWLYIVAGLLIAMMVSLAIPYAARRSEPPLSR